MEKDMILNLEEIIRSTNIMALDSDSIIYTKGNPYYIEVRNLDKKKDKIPDLPNNFIALPTLYLNTDSEFFKTKEDRDFSMSPLINTLYTIDSLKSITDKYIPNIRNRITTKLPSYQWSTPIRIIDTIIYPALIIISLDNEEEMNIWKSNRILKSFISSVCISYIYDSIYVHSLINSITKNNEDLDSILFSKSISINKRYHRTFTKILGIDLESSYIHKVYCDLSSIDDKILNNYRYYEKRGIKFKYIERVLEAKDVYNGIESDLRAIINKYSKTNDIDILKYSIENILNNI